MAEQEEIIIIQDDGTANTGDTNENISSEPQQEPNNEDQEVQKKKKILLIGGAAAVIILLITIIALLLIKKKSVHSDESSSITLINNKLSEKQKQVIEPSQLEKVIAKANYLYTNGNKQEALNLYEQIAVYSEAISQYNLGVAQIKEKQYDIALQSFQKAIDNHEKVCVSAINAAVCALHLNQQETFRHYIDLALAYLPKEINSPLYSYYYALIQYYKGNYVEALSALKHPSSDEYPKEKQLLRSRVDTLLGNYYDAIDTLSSPLYQKNALTLGLLYAHVGDMKLARKNLDLSQDQKEYPVRQQLALALIDLRSSLFQDAAVELKNVTSAYPEEVYSLYPIKVTLKDSVFQQESAQKKFRDDLNNDLWIRYEKIFYFAPYKVFNALSTISYIRKGTANIYIDDISTAKEYLEKSSSSSSVNFGIAQAIKKALSFKLRDANKQLQTLVQIQPKHSILHYDLALTYAQLGDIQNAYEHFTISYHLDSNNYLSGIFAIMCAEILHQDNSKFTSILKDNLANENDSEENTLYRTLFDISQNNFLTSSKWLDNTYQERPLYLIINNVIASKLGKDDIALKAVQKLSFLLPNDILPHLLYIDAKYKDSEIKTYARETLFYMKKQQLNYEDLYFGPYLTRYLYIQQALITGTIYPLEKTLEEKLNTTQENSEDIVYSLALSYLFSNNVEQSYILFNQLIDDFNINDDKTLFLGAVAAIAAKHHDNAIALLELAKLKNPQNAESRYALGLLYLEQKNNNGAAIQFGRINQVGFQSQYFNFDINTNALFFEKEHHL